jgi:tetratricopeptide (TPR) repeat protein
VHLTPTGNYLLARGIAEQGVALLAFDPSSTDEQTPGTSIAPLPEAGANPDAPRAWASEADCRVWLGLTDRNLYSLYGRVLRQMMNPPFRQQSSQSTQVRRLAAQQAGLRHSTEVPEIARMAGELRGRVTQRPHDGDLRSNYASMLALWGDLTGAEQEWREVIALLPHAVQAWVGLGMALEALGRPDDAARCYQECLRLSPLHPQGRARLEALASR